MRWKGRNDIAVDSVHSLWLQEEDIRIEILCRVPGIAVSPMQEDWSMRRKDRAG